MPTVTECQFLFSYLKFWSKFFIFPFEVNPLSGRIYNLSPLKATIWKVLYYLSFIHSIYNLTSTLALYIFYPERIVLYHLPVVFVGAILPLFFHLTYKPTFLDNNQTVKRVFNELFNNEETRPRPRTWKELNLTEFPGIYGMIAIVCCTWAEYVAIIWVEFNLPHLIMNMGLFKHVRSNAIFIVLAYLCEAYSSATFLINAGFFQSLNFLVISKVKADTDHIQTNLRRCWGHMRHIRNPVCELRESQLYVQFFNVFNAWYLHVTKTGLIMSAIIEGYIGLRYQSQPLVVVFYIYCHLSSIVIYWYTFRLGHSVVVGQQNAKRAILAASKSIRDRGVRHEVLKSLRSVKCVGLKVGQFHEVEQNSPIIFIDYVERQVIGLLLAF